MINITIAFIFGIWFGAPLGMVIAALLMGEGNDDEEMFTE